MKLVFDKKVLSYKGTLGFPERMVYAYDFLKDKYLFVKPDVKIKEPEVHDKELIEKVKERNFSDSDSPAYEDIYGRAILSLNSAVKAQEIQGFSLMEPPGHHAGKNFLGGFCYFNNIAEAVERSKIKTLILDIDGHHGNGTQDIFENSNNVFYTSLHRSPLYPGTGLDSGKNFLNYPLPVDCKEKIYLEILKKAIQKTKENFSFKQIAVSMGFDTYQDDLASLGLEKNSYKKIGKMIKDLANETNSRIFAVLEGGYTKNLGYLIHNFILGLKS